MYVGYALEGDGGRVVGVKGERERSNVRKLQLQKKRGENRRTAQLRGTNLTLRRIRTPEVG